LEAESKEALRQALIGVKDTGEEAFLMLNAILKFTCQISWSISES
jgi:hypothetical protein